MNNKTYIVRFFADGYCRVEGPFVRAQVQRLIDAGECRRMPLSSYGLLHKQGQNLT